MTSFEEVSVTDELAEPGLGDRGVGDVCYRRDGHVATLTIDRPQRRNAMSFETLAGLRDGVLRAKADREVRVLVLTGSGDKAFCSGADLGGLRGQDVDPEVAHAGRGHLAELFTTLWGAGIPTIAKVRGYALAGGFGLAMSCDIVIASDDATFGAPEVAIGLWPYMITVPLTRSMPPKIALELMMTGRRVPADEAARLGFVNTVVRAGDLDRTVEEMAALLASRSPSAIRLGRSSFYQTLGAPAESALPLLHATLSVATTTDDAAEGVAAFAEKREPVWGRRQS
ncbi:enoyl-CoA hydratase/isomerase family protein [Gordonia polyisoprenivorans]|uniref:enoyl-CoA hydratase/isomerase family protein n=1 Tax=Gordonia polyisoprenivorans TaxID=84595 RepID=UPI001AD7E06D|nr:enoyl-CoA hydratase-related protein [Gordonia polyisoprenivorans]QTI69001.1 enoyl-CoA hydratase/isomerase family protein [Gordonia polyisoprenivorans]